MEILLLAVLSGVLCSVVAQFKNYSGLLWFVLGFFFPVVGPIVIIFFRQTLTEENTPASPKTHVKCPDCKEFIRKEATVCKHCGCKLTAQVAVKNENKLEKSNQMIVCKKCNATNEEKNIECWKCGESI